MLDILKSLTWRFYLALLSAIGVLIIAGFLSWGLRLLGMGLLGAVATLFVLVPLLFAFLGTFYRVFGYFCSTPPWRDKNLNFPKPVDIKVVATDEQPKWAHGGMENSGTLRQFIEQNNEAPEKDDTELRIGIVLAGGGAKGVYQAGALRALWEFLEKEDALQYVRVITGTSIGSWNAMFWLTGQINDDTQRDWWASAAPNKLVGPTFYVPIIRNYILHNRPWRSQFTVLFGDKAKGLVNGGPPYFYFTRTNVERARLDLTTNRQPGDALTRWTIHGRQRVGSIVEPGAGRFQANSVANIEQAVFTSMDIPPAFRRLEGPAGEECEDGGVIDNLPIRFATRYEGCNLLFVFPLNATFQATPSDRSMLRRMFRVMSIRQGVLERDALRDISLYNAIISADANAREKHADIHVKPVTTFCICPEPPLDVGTFEFWKTRRLGSTAYTLMYEATRQQLEHFDFSINNHEVWMGAVNKKGEISYKGFTV